MQKNQQLRLTITGMTLEGMGVARHQGQVVFVPVSAVGDVVDVVLVKVHKRYAYGKILQVVTRSPHRRAEKHTDCPVFPQCGGCQFRHLTYEAECACKQSAVEENLRRLGGFDITLPPLIPAPSPAAYRNKAIYPVSTDKQGRLIAGFYAPRSHRVQDCKRCLLQPPVFDLLRQVVLDFCTTQKITAYDESTQTGLLRQIYFRRGHYSGEILVCLILNGKNLPAEKSLVEALLHAAPQIRSVILMDNTARTNVLLTDKIRVLHGDGFISDTMCGLNLTLSPLSFYQVNTPAAEVLYRIAADFAALTGAETVLDFYCGAGAVGLSMAHKAKEIIGAEVVSPAVENARTNAVASGITNARFLCADAGEAAQILLSQGVRPDVVLLDPPRAGCDASMLDALAKLSPQKIVYISCNSATLARDCALLREKGFALTQAQAVDLFPKTGHVETVIQLCRKKPNDVVHIDLDLDELDLTAAESKATYDEIKAYVLEQTGLKVSSLYISQVKRKCGIIERENYNLPKSKDARQPSCPPEKEKAIRAALKHFGMVR